MINFIIGFVGFLLVFGSVGGMETSTDSSFSILATQLLGAVIGLVMMFIATSNIKE
jgi:uncharacterized membrane protein